MDEDGCISDGPVGLRLSTRLYGKVFVDRWTSVYTITSKIAHTGSNFIGVWRRSVIGV